MTTLAHSLAPERARSTLAYDAVAVTFGSLIVAGLAQLYITLPFTPVPVTGQTLGVLLVSASLGSIRGAASMLLYLAWGAIGLPFFAEGESGLELLYFSSATAGYLWGFVIAGFVVGKLSERGWDRKTSTALGAMLIGEIIIFTLGVYWLGNFALDVPATKALEFGLYPFVVGDLLKLLIAAGLLPTVWRFVRGGGDRLPHFGRP